MRRARPMGADPPTNLPPGRDLACATLRATAWADPVEVASAFARAYACVLLGRRGWSTRCAARIRETICGAARRRARPTARRSRAGGGLAAMSSAQLSRGAAGARRLADLVLPLPGAAFHAGQRRALAIGPGRTRAPPPARADFALSAGRAADRRARRWRPSRPRHLDAATPAPWPRRGRIEAGEIFQANLARPWRGRLRRGAVRPSTSSAGSRGRARRVRGLTCACRAGLVSNSPERFLSVRPGDGLMGESTHRAPPRGADPADAACAELLASAKDRARTCDRRPDAQRHRPRVAAGLSVGPELAAPKSYATSTTWSPACAGGWRPASAPGTLSWPPSRRARSPARRSSRP